MEFEFVYKICNKSEWLLAKQNKKFTGTKKDKVDGFIHFSDKQQILGTLKKYHTHYKHLIYQKLNKDEEKYCYQMTVPILGLQF